MNPSACLQAGPVSNQTLPKGRTLWLSLASLLIAGCQVVQPPTDTVPPPVGSIDTLTHYRIRSDFNVPLNADEGWAAGINQPGTIATDAPFRLRVQVTSKDGRDALRYYLLEFSHNDGSWQPVVSADFPYPAYASPLVSIVSSPYPAGTTTDDLLPQGDLEHGEDGRGQGLAPVSSPAGERGAASEWEWPLVVRRYADGPLLTEDGDQFAFRLRHLGGDPVGQDVVARVSARVPDGHLGGTFVETPGRIGPWQTRAGHLYFIMEPTETDNRFMVVRSTDRGRSWEEVDGANRPSARDLEAVDSAHIGGVLHILHQEDDVWYHAFHTSDHSESPDQWSVRSELVARVAKPPVQSVALGARSDGSLVAFYAAGPTIEVRIRSSDGTWSDPRLFAEAGRPSGLQVLSVPGDALYVVFTQEDGTAWLQRFEPDNSPSQRWLISDQIGRAEADIGSILPPVFIPETGEVLVVYREADGRLNSRRLLPGDSGLSPAVTVSERPVVQNAVDSDQTGADLVIANGRAVVIFIDAHDHDLYYCLAGSDNSWSPPEILVDQIDGSWIRAFPMANGDIGLVYDAGSLGGSGMNRFAILPLD